jgi:putative nucleotidyltransferase with HDIG domain
MLDVKYLEHQLKWLIKLRWIAIIGALVLASVAKGSGFFDFPSALLYRVLGFSALGNLFFALTLHWFRSRLITFALLQVFVDQLTLGVLLYISGACLSPFLYFFLFHVVIGGILLPYQYTAVVAGSAAAVPGIVILLSHENLLPHYDIFNQSASRVVDVPAFLVHASAFFGTLVLTAYFVIYLNKRLHQSNNELKRTNEKLSSLVLASRPHTELSELEQVFSGSFRAILDQPSLVANILTPDEEWQKLRCYQYYPCSNCKCPAYHTESACWQLLGTLCPTEDASPADSNDNANRVRRPHSDPAQCSARTYDDKMNTCTRCEYFARIVAARGGPSSGTNTYAAVTGCGEKLNERESIILSAMRDGQILLQGKPRAGRQPDPAGPDTLIFPLRIHDRLSGLLQLTAKSEILCTDDTLDYIRLFSEVTSTGLFGTSLFEYLETSYLQIVMALANAVEAKDPYTRGHSERVAFHSIQIAMALDLTKQEKEHLSFAAILHDIGKIGTNIEILHKKEKLIALEQEDMMAHSLIGARILEPVHFLKPIIAAIRHHHENYDGSGYPSGLKGAAIPLKARIVKISDAWDAMTSDRPYRTALSKSKALEQLTHYSGIQFDPELVGVFVQTQALQDASS